MADGCPPKGQAIVRAKNTFLEFKVFPCVTSDRVRRSSEPSAVARLNAEEVMFMMEWNSNSFTEDCSDLVQLTSEDLEFYADTNESTVQGDSHEEENNCNNSETGTFTCGDSDRLRLGSTPSRIGSVDVDEQAETSDTSHRVRSGSDPLTIANLDAEKVVFSMEWNSDASTEECSDLALWTSEDFGSDLGANESSVQKKSHEGKCNNSEAGVLACDDTDRFRHDLTPSYIGSVVVDEQVKTSQASISEYCGGMLLSSELTLRTKNTFLDLKFDVDDNSPKIRCLSAPAWLLQISEDLAPSSDADERLQTTAESFEEESGQAEVEDHMSTSRKSPSKAKRDRERGRKRLRNKKRFLSLCEQIDEDPEGFDIALIESQLVIDGHFVGALKAHRAKALQKLASKGAHMRLGCLSS